MRRSNRDRPYLVNGPIAGLAVREENRGRVYVSNVRICGEGEVRFRVVGVHCYFLLYVDDYSYYFRRDIDAGRVTVDRSSHYRVLLTFQL